MIRRAEDQIEALTTNVVDALYAHSPFLEDALVRLGAMLYVNQSSGDIAPLANGQIHSLGATKEYVAAHPDVILKVTRAIARAQELLHADPAAAAAAAIERNATLYPARPTMPDFSKLKAADYLAPSFAEQLLRR